MLYTAKAEKNINLAPDSLVEEVLQNISMLLSTIKETVPLHRDFGLSGRFLDKPTPTAEAMIVAELFDVIEQYEPRAKINNVSFVREEMTGKIAPVLEVEINE